MDHNRYMTRLRNNRHVAAAVFVTFAVVPLVIWIVNMGSNKSAALAIVSFVLLYHLLLGLYGKTFVVGYTRIENDTDHAGEVFWGVVFYFSLLVAAVVFSLV